MAEMVELDLAAAPVWDRVFTVAPLVLVGTREPDGGHDLAPKHLAMPIGWTEWYCFACSPEHATEVNARRTGVFTVSYPRPAQLVSTGQAAAPRTDAGDKPTLGLLGTQPATAVDGVLVDGATLWLECELEQVLEGYGRHSLVIGRIVRAAADPAVLRDVERDDADLLHQEPLLAFLPPSRFAEIAVTRSFPFPVDFHR